MRKKIHFVINPSSGQDYPILSVLYRKFHQSNMLWSASVPTNVLETREHVKDALKRNVDIIGIFGGDGTVTEAAKIMCNKKIPMAIIPGGTANVLAKELLLPLTIEENIDLLLSKKTKKYTLDMGKANNELFVLRVNIGVFAEMVTEVNKDLKKTIGQLAYSIKGLQKLANNQPSTYTLEIDGKTIETQGVALMVANTANIGLKGISIFPDSSAKDGKLDVIVIQSKDLGFLTEAAAKTIVPDGHPPLQRWKGKKITIYLPEKRDLLLDDTPFSAKTLHIEVVPKSLSVLVPK